MNEIITVKEKEGGIDILGGQEESGLLINGKLIQFTFVRTVGTMMRYKIGKEIISKDLIDEKKFRGFVKYGYLSNESLHFQFSYLINLLSKGEYCLETIEISSREYFTEVKKIEKGFYSDISYNNNVFYDDKDTYELDILMTQYSFNEDIVKDYIKLIKDGIKPIVIFFKQEKSNDAYILDGHHKYIAYSRSGKKVKGLLITKFKPNKIDMSLGLNFLKILKRDNGEFKKRFLQKN